MIDNVCWSVGRPVSLNRSLKKVEMRLHGFVCIVYLLRELSHLDAQLDILSRSQNPLRAKSRAAGRVTLFAGEPPILVGCGALTGSPRLRQRLPLSKAITLAFTYCAAVPRNTVIAPLRYFIMSAVRDLVKLN